MGPGPPRQGCGPDSPLDIGSRGSEGGGPPEPWDPRDWFLLGVGALLGFRSVSAAWRPLFPGFANPSVSLRPQGLGVVFLDGSLLPVLGLGGIVFLSVVVVVLLLFAPPFG